MKDVNELVESYLLKEDELTELNDADFYDPEKVKEALGKIDELSGLISNMLGIEINFTVGNDRRGYVDIKSQDLMDQMPKFLTHLFKTFVVDGYIKESVDGDMNYIIWGSIDFRYDHPTGGSNGSEVARVEYKDGKWSAKSMIDMYRG